MRLLRGKPLHCLHLRRRLLQAIADIWEIEYYEAINIANIADIWQEDYYSVIVNIWTIKRYRRCRHLLQAIYIAAISEEDYYNAIIDIWEEDYDETITDLWEEDKDFADIWEGFYNAIYHNG